MNKVLVIGSGGSGKSTFSRRLDEILDIGVIHLDTLYWKLGWIETPKPEWGQLVAELLKQDSWIMDGNYSGTLDLRLEACDTVIFLDIARTVCLWRVWKRLLMYRKGNRQDMAQGCEERFSLQFMLWIWNYPKRTRPKVLRLLEENSQSKNVIRLRTQDEVDRFLARVRAKDNNSSTRARQVAFSN